MTNPVSVAFTLPLLTVAFVTAGTAGLAASADGSVINNQTLVPLAWLGASMLPTIGFVWWLANDRAKAKARQERDARRSRRAFILGRAACEASRDVDHTKGIVREAIVAEEAEGNPTVNPDIEDGV